MKLYRFSPIQDEQSLKEAVVYIGSQTSELAEKILGEKLPITSLTVFSHYQSEFDKIVSLLPNLGQSYNENNGPRITLREPIQVGENLITHLRIRKPDPYRMQVGCNDFDVENYSDFKSTFFTENTKGLRLLSRKDYEMIEFFDPDFDVLAYVVSKEI